MNHLSLNPSYYQHTRRSTSEYQRQSGCRCREASQVLAQHERETAGQPQPAKTSIDAMLSDMARSSRDQSRGKCSHYVKAFAGVPALEYPWCELCYPPPCTSRRIVGSQPAGLVVLWLQQVAPAAHAPGLLGTYTQVAQTSIQRRRSVWTYLPSPPVTGLA